MAGTAILLCIWGDGDVSDSEFQMPRKFTFDEFYNMLKEFVNDPKVREYLAIYDAEDAEGRGELLDGSQCSFLAEDSHSMFISIGWSILVKNGWPNYGMVVKISDVNLRLDVMSIGNTIWKIGRRLIRKEPRQKGWDFQDVDYDINDRESVLRLLRQWAKAYKFEMPYELTFEEWSNKNGN